MMPLVAFRIHGDPFYTYSLLVAAGLCIGVLGLALEGLRRGWAPERLLEILVWALVPATVGGRLAYLLALAPPDVLRPVAWLKPWGDGIAWPPALLAGALGLAMWAAWRRQPCLELLGGLVPGLALGQAVGWLGAAAHGASAGIPLPAERWAPYMRDLYGVILPRFPLQHLAAGLCLGAWLLIAAAPVRGGAGRVACYALITGAGLCALLFWRDGRVVLWGGLSLEQIEYLAVGATGLSMALANRSRMARRPALVTS